MMKMLSNIDQIANLIIRPSRYAYKLTDLGSKNIPLSPLSFILRQDFSIPNPRNLHIKGSIYTCPNPSNQFLIYLHCNSGSRIQGLVYMKMAIENGFNYVTFDFTGSGMSDGKFVSLGYYQTTDLQIVYNHLKAKYNNINISLWGRSMGAVTALNFLLKRKYQVAIAVFDSPFRSLKDLFIQIGRQKTNFPDFILQMAYKYIKPIIQQKADFNIEDVDLKIQNNLISNPGIFIASKQDSLVPFNQIDQLFNAYKGQKQMLFIEEGHNQARNTKLIKQIFKSMKGYLNSSEKDRVNLNSKKNYQSYLPQRKQLSRKKLQLTIKSLSQRHLVKQKTFLQPIYQQIKQANTPILQKKQISCLLPHKKSLKILQIQQDQQRPNLLPNKSQSKLRIKRKPFMIRNFFNEEGKQTKQHKQLKQNKQHKQHKQLKQAKQAKPTAQTKHNNSKDKIIGINLTSHVSSDLLTQSPSTQVLSGQIQQKVRQSPTCTQVFIEQQSPSCISEHIRINHKKIRILNDSDQPNSDIKKQTGHINKINFNNDFKQRQFLKRCQSLQRILMPIQINNQKHSNIHSKQCQNHLKLQQKTKQINANLNIQPNLQQYQNTNTFRQVKCTQRVLQKIIQKQQKKLLILNVKKTCYGQIIKNRAKQPNIKQANQTYHQNEDKPSKQRKTLQHIGSKKPPFVQLKGIRNYRNSLESKYKTEIRK